ncbi:hypothetical protein GE118_00240 [Mycoplasma sp. NEAQ87857]|uniref:hypothetical protein n=1 Tax=Mycoplasma sp. NEAQ87857 TaxID=2683967 RepID=UPI001316AF9B|nr:hypothetical protein [Mycoplasma sp. NEAQ87857]QGZ97232.1 hypothetical protein GE118_00240 [Mycoplasma sp. NEAQ87857]
MRKIKLKKVPFRTKLRWLFLGKRPLERKYMPKIMEYLYLMFNNVLVLIATITMIYMLNQNWNSEFSFGFNFLKLLKQDWWFKFLATSIFILYIVNILFNMHIYYILSKTEFNKWIGIVASVLSFVLFLSPLTILFAIVAYVKNEIAFE